MLRLLNGVAFAALGERGCLLQDQRAFHFFATMLDLHVAECN